MEYTYNETIIKEIDSNWFGKNPILYEISIIPAFYFMFEIKVLFKVGDKILKDQILAEWSTEEIWGEIRVDFDAHIVEINQPLLDFFELNADKHLNKHNDKFLQKDWIFRVRKNQYMYRQSSIKEISYNVYEISCVPVEGNRFYVEEVLAVGENVFWKDVAQMKVEDRSFMLCIDFNARITEINQPLIDYTQQNKDKNSSQNPHFLQTDWICRLEKIETSRPFVRYTDVGNNVDNLYNWWEHIDSTIYRIGFVDSYLPRNAYIRNIKILSKNKQDIKKNEAICSFEYSPKYLFLDYLSETEKWQQVENGKYVEPAFLHACYDFEEIEFNLDILLAVQYSLSGWIEINMEKDYILEAKRKINHYTYNGFWYKLEGEYLRIGMDINDNEYLNVHGVFPEHTLKVGQIIKENENLLILAVNGPLDYELDAPFDIEIITLNPIYENFEYWGDESVFLHRFPEENLYEESWILLVKALNYTQMEAFFEVWKQERYFK